MKIGSCGKHAILELHGVSRMDEVEYVEEICGAAATHAGATILSIHFHKFGGAGGVTGLVLLSESHISVHTWPEYQYAAIDVFMCGIADPLEACGYIIESFTPSDYDLDVLSRGTRETTGDAAARQKHPNFTHAAGDVRVIEDHEQAHPNIYKRGPVTQ